MNQLRISDFGLRNQDERRRRVLRAGSLQELWALLLIYLILLGVALLFGREVVYEIAFGVCIAVAVLVTVAFLALHLLDRMTAAVSEWMEKNRELKKPRYPEQRN
jgi:hypothetical protein